MINPRIKATSRFIKELRSILKNWEYYTRDNTGIYENKVRYVLASGTYTWTKQEIYNLIKVNLEYIRNELKQKV